MFQLQRTGLRVHDDATESPYGALLVRCIALICAVLFASSESTLAQNVVTQHYDNVRSGANTNETILNTGNVNTNSFGKLFSQSVDGQIYAQPLYLSNVAVPSKGTHNVIFVATEGDSVYAFDADTNGGPNASPLWHASLRDAAHGAGAGASTVSQADVSSGDISPQIGITGTPTIDASTNTMYVVSKTKESGSFFQRLHALDITTGAEKFGGPVTLAASVSGNGNGSSGGVLNFDPKWENNRPGLLLLNGVVYIGFASHGDNGPWHGWLLAYNAATLAQTSAWCGSPNGIGAGIWMGGSGLAADTLNPTGNSPGGRLFVATGNGTFDTATPRTNYGDSLIRIHLNNGVMTLADFFTPSNQSGLNSQDQDVASGGVLILPDQSGTHTHILVQVGKEGKIYVVDRENMGGFNASTDNNIQEIAVVPGQTFPNSNSIGGLWGMPAYGNNAVYMWGRQDKLRSFPVSAGRLPTSSAKNAPQTAGFPDPTPVITSNGTASPIIWTIQADGAPNNMPAILRAHDATNISTTLYDSTSNTARDNPGNAVKFTVPTVINGKVYVGTQAGVAVYGLLNGQQQAAVPLISPGGESFTGTLTITITDSTPNAQIFYSLTGTATTASTPYTGPFTITSTQTVSAIASAAGFLQSNAATETYTLQTQTLMPTFSPGAGTYGSTQTVVISDASPNPTIYYAINAPATTSSTPFAGQATVTVGQSETLNAIATSPGLSTSPQSTATYTINSGSSINFPSGFASAASSMTFNGSTTLDDTRLQLTDGNLNETASAWFRTPVDIRSFTNDFSFQLSNPGADGFTFAIQNTNVNAVGPGGGGLGYGPNAPGGVAGIGKSIAVKFDIFDNNGEGPDSTGLYTNGASPTTPAVDMSGSTIDLHSGDTMNVHMVYDGAKLTMTITDGVNGGTFTTSWNVNIPSIVGGNTAFVGFTAGTGGLAASQKIETWNFQSTAAQQAATPPIFSPAAGTYTSTQTVTITDATPNSTIFYTLDGTAPGTAAGGSTLQYTGAITVAASETIMARATSVGFSPSSVATAAYVINAGSGSTPINFGSGFTATGMQFNGHTKLNGSRLQLTDASAAGEIASAFWTTPVNVQSFTNDFMFQLTSPSADGFTFTIQRAGVTAIGPGGGGLGYGPSLPGGTGGIGTSVAVKFDLYDNNGEGTNSTGLYVNGASPTTPATTLGNGVNLHSGDNFKVHMTYDGTTLTMTITDLLNTAQTFTTSWPINIPGTIGANTGFAGFTGGTGGLMAVQEITNWTYSTTGTPAQPAATPQFSPAAGTYTTAQSVTITDATPGSSIFYTLDNSQPGTAVGGSTQKYSAPITVGNSETIQALATAPGFTTSPVNSAAYVINLPAAPTPVISPATGTYTSAQTVTITDSGTTIFYTIDGSNPTTSATKYTAPFTVSTSTTVKAIATAPGFATSATAQSIITINTGGTAAINFGSGFSAAGMQFNGHTKLNGTRLQLTDTTATGEAASAFWTTPVNVQTFTNDFTFQVTSPSADGFTFTIQRAGVTAIGPSGGGLCYGPNLPGGAGGIPTSIAVKFDLYDNNGEGTNSTGLYLNGASPTTPATTFGGGVNLHSGDNFKVHMTYDGTTLTMTVTDLLNTAQTFTTSWAVNIPGTIGANTAFVGFTAGTGGLTAQQEIVNWTYSTSGTASKAPVVYRTVNLPATATQTTFRQLAWTGFPDGTGTIIDGINIGDSVTFTVSVATAGTYDIKLSSKDLNTRGIFQLSINGTAVGSPQDEYINSGSGVYVVHDIGTFNFAAAGNYAFKFTVSGKNAASSAFSMDFDDITLTPQ
jgi:Legume lectin domain/Chitobiase/beta-hexosaminidase C-terminal domain